jgi:methylated-DNA-[protein]-cysteine S-methyltransferase
MTSGVWSVYESPIGRLTLVTGAAGLSAVHFPDEGGPFDEAARDDAALSSVRAQLDEYFCIARTRFALDLDLSGGTEFQRRVWKQLLTIPYGTTLSYGALTVAAGGPPERTRAVAAAVGRTPIPIIVPCHRVIGARGGLAGYRGGLDRKRALLDHEAAVGGREPLSEVWAARQTSLI